MVGCPPHTSASRQVPVLLVVPIAVPDALPTQTCQSQGGASSASHESRVSAAHGPWGRGAGLAFRFLGVDLRPRAASLLHWGPRQGTPPQCRAPALSLTDGVCMWTQSCRHAGQLPITQTLCPISPMHVQGARHWQGIFPTQQRRTTLGPFSRLPKVPTHEHIQPSPRAAAPRHAGPGSGCRY